MTDLASKRLRRLAVLSTGRQDWGILRSLCRWLQESPSFELELLLGGMACEERFGSIDQLVLADGFSVERRLAWMEDDGSIGGAAGYVQASRATAMVGHALASIRPDALVIVGDRLETLAAATAATLLRVPLVHLHGGEETEGAFDNAIRHAVTKLSHLHLVSHPTYAQRIVAMGEDPASVHVVGAPGLDNLQRNDLAAKEELETFLRASLTPPIVVVTVHPATLADDPDADVLAVCAAMKEVDATYVITLPNSDPGNDSIRSALAAFASTHPRAVTVEALGERRFWGVLRIASAMLGNSSSGLIEAPALRLPVVNVGDRQKGRLRSAGVIDVAARPDATAAALRLALDPAFRAGLQATQPPFGAGAAAPLIGQILREWKIEGALTKRAILPGVPT